MIWQSFTFSQRTSPGICKIWQPVDPNLWYWTRQVQIYGFLEFCVKLFPPSPMNMELEHVRVHSSLHSPLNRLEDLEKISTSNCHVERVIDLLGKNAWPLGRENSIIRLASSDVRTLSHCNPALPCAALTLTHSLTLSLTQVKKLVFSV